MLSKVLLEVVLTEKKDVTLGEVKRSFFMFIVVVGVFFLTLPSITKVAGVSIPMLILQGILGLVLILCTAINGSIFLEKLLSYLSQRK